MTSRIFITGAGGFLGGWFAEALHVQGRYQVVAGVNRWAGAARIARFPIEFVQANLLDPASIEKALDGVDAIIHCAIAETNEQSDIATRNLFEAARKLGIPKVIHISSVGIYGDVKGLVTEDTAPVEPVGDYGNGKRQTELIAKEFASPSLQVSVLRPTLIYGPFSTSWTLPVITRIRSRQWQHLGDKGEGKANLVYVGDVVRHALHLLEHQTEPFVVHNSNGPEIPTWNEYYSLTSEAMGFGPLRPSSSGSRAVGLQVLVRRPIRIAGKYVLKHHRGLLTALQTRSFALTDLLRRTEEDLRLKPNDIEMGLFSADVTYSNGRANAAGFVPATSLAKGVAYSVEWAKAVGLR